MYNSANQSVPDPDNERRTLKGYARPAGKVGTRNYIAVIAADEPLIEAFQEVNAAKSAISTLLQRIKQSEYRVTEYS